MKTVESGRENDLTNEEIRQLGELLWRNRDIIRRVADRMLVGEFQYLKDDCVNEVFLVAAQKGRALLAHPYQLGWLCETTRNIAHSYMRKNKHDLLNVSEDVAPEPSSADTIADDIQFAEWVKSNVPEKLLSRLGKREKQVYEMIFLQNMTCKEVALELNLSDSTVRTIKKDVIDKITYAIKIRDF